MSFGFAVESPRAEPALPLRYTDGHLMAIANWKNQTIWTGDNLDIMRGMNSESVDLIYLDPPFNSNRTYSAPIGSKAAGAAFKDAWTLDDVDLAWVGLIAEKEPSLPSVIEAAGIAHGKSMEAYLVMMAVRLLEMRRLLKPTGSVYLHCDPTAGHYLKMLMDAVFGWRQFRNEIVWCYKGGGKSKSDFGRKHDTILRYVRGAQFRFNADSVRVPYEGEGTGRTDVSRWGSRRVGDTDVPYEPNPKGKVPEDWWDIPQLNSNAPERVGYPTQKPLKLLDRIIRASSNEGDVVLDPFCGCATTCVSAHALGRMWTGIDISEKAAELIVQRLQQDYLGEQIHWMTHAPKVIHRDKPPQRTDVGKLPPYKTHKHTLYGKQEGKCAGCGHHFPFQNFTVDHVVAKAKGGTDHIDNLQLLCNHCNSVKGTMDQAAFKVKLSGMRLGA